MQMRLGVSGVERGWSAVSWVGGVIGTVNISVYTIVYCRLGTNSYSCSGSVELIYEVH